MRQPTMPSTPVSLGTVQQDSQRYVGVTPINVNPQANEVSLYHQTRNDDIITAMKGYGYDDKMLPTATELQYVNSVFQSKGFHELKGVTFAAVENIGKQELETLNNELKKFMLKMNGIDTAGIFGLIDSLSKEIQDQDLEGLWKKAVNTKPTLLARFINLFNNGYGARSIQNKLQTLHMTLTNSGGALEAKIASIEAELVQRRDQQIKNIQTLEEAFGVYFKAFEHLRRQWCLIVYLEHSFKNMLEVYKANNANSQDMLVMKNLQEYNRTYNFMQSRRILMHKTLIGLQMVANQNDTLIKVCTNLLDEMENTRLGSFPSIRSSLVNISMAISAEKALLSTTSTQTLDAQLSTLSAQTSYDLAVKTELLASESRLRDATLMENTLKGLSEFNTRLKATRATAQQNFDNATQSLTKSAKDAQTLLGEITHGY